MDIIHKRGYAVSKDVDCVINSANGFLLLGTSGAGAIRSRSQRLTTNEKKEYALLLKKLPENIRNDYVRVFKEQGWTPTYAQLGCLKLLSAKKGHEFRRGEAVLQKDWSRKDKRPIIHAVGMSYKLHKNFSTRLGATPKTVRDALTKALKLADAAGAKSIALPVMCSRPTYGLGPKESLRIITSVLKSFKAMHIKKVIICFDNKISGEYLKKIER